MLIFGLLKKTIRLGRFRICERKIEISSSCVDAKPAIPAKDNMWSEVLLIVLYLHAPAKLLVRSPSAVVKFSIRGKVLFASLADSRRKEEYKDV